MSLINSMQVNLVKLGRVFIVVCLNIASSCISAQRGTVKANDTPEDVPQNSAQEEPHSVETYVPYGLLAKLVRKGYPVECSICLDQFTETNLVVKLSCNCKRALHLSCADEWRRKRPGVPPTCPTCREPYGRLTNFLTGEANVLVRIYR